MNLNNFFHGQKMRLKYRNELSLIKGSHFSKSNTPSVLFFTAHKCASVFIGKTLRELTSEIELTPINPGAYFSSVGKSEEATKLEMALMFRPTGYLYGPFRQPDRFYLVDDPNKYKKILVLRDPRDVLTSSYFSFGFSHSVPVLSEKKKDFLAKREKIKQQTIEEYVEGQWRQVFAIYDSYRNILLQQGNDLLFLRYEDMISNFEEWLLKIVHHLNIRPSESALGDIIEQTSFKVDSENKNSHKRRVTPGDYKEKLNIELIENLNKEFKEILNLLEYDSD